MNFQVTNQQQVQCDEIVKVILVKKPLPDHMTRVEGLKDDKIMDAIYKTAAQVINN